MKLIFVLTTLLAISAQATCPTNRTAHVRAAAYSRATDSLTYCGTKMQIVELLSQDACSLTAAETVGQFFYFGNGQLVNGHDCEVPQSEGEVLILKIDKLDQNLEFYLKLKS